MIKKLFVIRDMKTDIFTPPHAFVNKGQLSRELAQIQNDQNNTMSLYPDDYVVYCLGDFDDTTGSIILADAPERVYSLAELFKQLNRYSHEISNETPVQSDSVD